MKSLMMAGVVAVAFGSNDPPQTGLEIFQTRDLPFEPLLIAQARTPDTSMPGSTAPANPQRTRPAHVPRQERIYAAEIRKCETLGNAEQRLACKNSVRSRFGEM